MRHSGPAILILAAMLWAYAYHPRSTFLQTDPKLSSTASDSRWVARRSPLAIPAGASNISFVSAEGRPLEKALEEHATRYIERAEHTVRILTTQPVSSATIDVLSTTIARGVDVKLSTPAIVGGSPTDATKGFSFDACPEQNDPALFLLALDGKRLVVASSSLQGNGSARTVPFIILEDERSARVLSTWLDRRSRALDNQNSAVASDSPSGLDQGLMVGSSTSIARRLETALRRARRSIDFMTSKLDEQGIISTLDELGQQGIALRGVLSSSTRPKLLAAAPHTVVVSAEIPANFFVIDNEKLIIIPPFLGASLDPALLACAVPTSDPAILRAYREQFDRAHGEGLSRTSSRMERALR